LSVDDGVITTRKPSWRKRGRATATHVWRPTANQSKLTDPSNWHWTQWLLVFRLHTLDGATGLTRLLPLERPKARVLKGYLSLTSPYRGFLKRR